MLKKVSAIASQNPSLLPLQGNAKHNEEEHEC